MELLSKRKQSSTAARCLLARKPELRMYKAARQQVQKEAAQELVDWQVHHALPVAMRGVSPAEGHRIIDESNESAVGDADAVGVCAEITQSVLGPP